MNLGNFLGRNSLVVEVDHVLNRNAMSLDTDALHRPIRRIKLLELEVIFQLHGGPSRGYCLSSAMRASTLSGVTSMRCSSLTSTQGAPSHAPMHSANSRLILPSAVVPPGSISSLSQRFANNSSPPRSIHGKLRQTQSLVLPRGFCSLRKKP